ncbi:MAG: hypothetical protein P9L94_18125 [Candidatus Hinthialibacter antarcticus]|nr:hypothetical protein [Candidatus Hinthialibacter antarcticus]
MVSYLREEGFGRERSLLWIAAIGLAVYMVYGSIDALIPHSAEQSFSSAFFVAHDRQESLYSIHSDPLWRWTLQRIANWGAIEIEIQKTTALFGLGMLIVACSSLRSYFRKEQNLYSDFSVMWFVCAVLIAPIYGTSAPLSILLISLLAPLAASMRSPSIVGAFGVGIFSSLLLLSNQGLVWFVVALNGAMFYQEMSKRGPHRIFACIWSSQLVLIGGYYSLLFITSNQPEAFFFQRWHQSASWLNFAMPDSLYDFAFIASCLLGLGVVVMRTPMAWLGWGVLLHGLSLLVLSSPGDELLTSAVPVAAIAVLAPDWIHNQKVFPHQIRIVLLMAAGLVMLAASVYAITL